MKFPPWNLGSTLWTHWWNKYPGGSLLWHPGHSHCCSPLHQLLLQIPLSKCPWEWNLTLQMWPKWQNTLGLLVFFYDWTFGNAVQVAVAFLATASRFCWLPFSFESKALGFFTWDPLLSSVFLSYIHVIFVFNLSEGFTELQRLNHHWLSTVCSMLFILIPDTSWNPLSMTSPLFYRRCSGAERGLPQAATDGSTVRILIWGGTSCTDQFLKISLKNANTDTHCVYSPFRSCDLCRLNLPSSFLHGFSNFGHG